MESQQSCPEWLWMGLWVRGSEELVPVDEVAGVALGSEVQIGRKRAAVQQDAAQARAYLPGLEVGRRDPPQRLDDSFHRDLHAHPSFPSS